MRIKLKTYLCYTCGVSLICLHLTLRYSLGLIEDDHHGSMHPTNHQEEHCQNKVKPPNVHKIYHKRTSENSNLAEKRNKNISMADTKVTGSIQNLTKTNAWNNGTNQNITKWIHSYLALDKSNQEKYYRYSKFCPSYFIQL